MLQFQISTLHPLVNLYTVFHPLFLWRCFTRLVCQRETILQFSMNQYNQYEPSISKNNNNILTDAWLYLSHVGKVTKANGCMVFWEDRTSTWPGCLYPLWHHKGVFHITACHCTHIVVRVGSKKDWTRRIQIIYLSVTISYFCNQFINWLFFSSKLQKV